MKLSDDLQQCHVSGDFGKALEGYAERAKQLEDALEIAYCQMTGSDTPHGLASCDDFKDWLKSVGV